MSKKKRLKRIQRQVEQVSRSIDLLTYQVKQINQRHWRQGQAGMKAEEHPLVQEFVTDAQGHLAKVVLRFEDYQRLMGALNGEARRPESAEPREPS